METGGISGPAMGRRAGHMVGRGAGACTGRRPPLPRPRRRLRAPAVAAALLWVACGAPDGEAGSEPEGGAEAPADAASGPAPAGAEAVLPGVVSTAGGESWITFSPDGRRVVFGRHGDGWSGHTLWTATREGDDPDGGWGEPERLPFSGSHEDRGARFSPDGRWLWFSSSRPRPDGTTLERGDMDLWRVRLDGDRWGEPERLPAPVSTPAPEIHPSIASDGTVWFASAREGGRGRSDLYRAREGGGGWTVEAVAALNTERSEPDVFVDPAGRFLVFARTDDPEGFGGDDLWIALREGDGWSAPRNLGEAVNTPEYEYGPAVSPDGRWLYFTSHRVEGEQADVYRIPVEAVGLPRE